MEFEIENEKGNVIGDVVSGQNKLTEEAALGSVVGCKKKGKAKRRKIDSIRI